MQMQIDATRQLIDLNSNMVEILQYQFAKGYASRLDVAAQESQLAQVAATLPPLHQAVGPAARSAGGSGRPVSEPGAGREIRACRVCNCRQELPVSLPSQLVAQRPDVLQAEANLHAASAQIGIAIANRLPNIALTANAGSTALAIDQLFTSGTGFWGLGAAADRASFPGRHTAAPGARREGRLCAGGRAISQHGADRLSECRRHLDRAANRTPRA